VAERFYKLEERWSRTAARHLPYASPASSWRASHESAEHLPPQGWKLHVAATILSAEPMLRRIGPVLHGQGVYFKGPRDLRFLDRLNTGLDGYSQVGKCFTVYCRDDAEAKRLAPLLHQITDGVAHPDVPFDRCLQPASAVHYRYGAFSDATVIARGGERVAAIRNQRGRLVPDRREPGMAVPKWVDDPLATGDETPIEWTPLALDYRAFQVLRQRGKGGVYLGLDLTKVPAVLCVIKEGLRHGETDPVGHDGYWRVKREARTLRALRRAGVPVPAVRAEFDAGGGRYLVLEHIAGPTLAEVIAAGDMTSDRARLLHRAVGAMVSQVHRAGWAWRDVKPENIVVSAGSQVRPLDFETACRLEGPAPAPWGTAHYLPARWSRGEDTDPVAEDKYALRVIGKELRRAIDSRTRPT
jgi:hypothetical protein